MGSKKNYKVRVEVSMIFEVPVLYAYEEEADEIAELIVWNRIPESVQDQCLSAGSRAIEKDECFEYSDSEWE